VTSRSSGILRMALTAFLGLLLASTAFSQEAIVRGKCVGVHDGDSCTLLVSGDRQIKIRVAFLDAPELGQPFGYRAKKAMSNLLFGKYVLVRPHTIDRYGRLVGLVYVEGADAGLQMLRQGLAWCYTRYLPRPPRISNLATGKRRRRPESSGAGSGATLVRSSLGCIDDRPGRIRPSLF
jgi:endonuclease YncB( thermonuclease family)